MSTEIEELIRRRDEFIQSLPPERKKRAEQLQWQWDTKLALCKDDTQRFNKAIELFWEQFNVFKRTIDGTTNAHK